MKVLEDGCHKHMSTPVTLSQIVYNNILYMLKVIQLAVG